MRKKLLLFVAVSLLGIFCLIILFFSSGSTSKSNKTNVIPTPESYYPLEAQELVRQFFEKYDYCLKTSSIPQKSLASETCIKDSQIISKNFLVNITSNEVTRAENDPVACSKESTINVTIDPKLITDDDVIHVLVINKQASTDIPIDVQLVQEGSTWKINNILCQN